MQIAPADWIVLIGYFVFIGAVGLAAGMRVKDTDHYFLGSRRFGKWLMMGQSFGVGTHAEMPVSLAGAVSQHGFSGIWFQWKNLFATPFFWLFAPLLRRIRRTTLAELTEDRYGRGMGGLYIGFALVFFTINSASMLKGAGKVISQAAGGQFAANDIVVAMTVIFIAYSFVGGLVAAAWTDFFQGFLILVLSFLLIPLGWGVVGGLRGMKESLDPAMFSLAAPEGIGPWYIFMLTLNGLVGILAQPHMLAAVGTGKDERACRIGFFYGNYLKRICTVGWAVVGLMVAAMVARGSFGVRPLADPEEAFGFACRHLLFPGALGLLIASVLAANMSTASAFMVNSGALFTEGIYRKCRTRVRSDRHYLWVGRISGFAITLLGVVYALFFIDRVLYSFLLTETLATYMGIGLLGGIVWRRANRWGALASVVAAFATNFLVYHGRGERFDHWDPDVFCLAFAAGVAALIAVSLLTRPEPAERLESFFNRLETPTELPGRSGDPLEDPVPLPPGEMASATAAAGRQSLIVHLLHPLRGAAGAGWRTAYRDDLGGFLRGWLWVLGLVGVTGWLLGR